MCIVLVTSQKNIDSHGKGQCDRGGGKACQAVTVSMGLGEKQCWVLRVTIPFHVRAICLLAIR